VPRRARCAPGGVRYHAINRSCAGSCVFAAPEDYRYFIYALQKTQAHGPVELIAACLMPNHFHFVVRPARTGDLGRWMQRLMTTHVRWHHGRRGTYGPLWQGRFKVFPIAEDDHLATVMRYVERNAVRARLVQRAEQWEWSSLNWRMTGRFRDLLAPPPISLPANWPAYVNAPQTPAELASLRLCVSRNRPFGKESWAREVATELGLEASMTDRGRPRKSR
jgi:putative transposase